MPESPIGITFQPSAQAAANGPRQAGLEGQGGSDLAQAFKILSLHLPRVLGASAIAPKRLLTSQGSAGVAAPMGVNPYSAVFQALLQSMGAGGAMNPSGPTGGMLSGGGDIQSLASLFGGPTSQPGADVSSGYDMPVETPAPRVTPGHDYKTPPDSYLSSRADYLNSTDYPADTRDTQYI